MSPNFHVGRRLIYGQSRSQPAVIFPVVAFTHTSVRSCPARGERLCDDRSRNRQRLARCYKLRARAKSCSGSKMEEIKSAEPLFDQQVSYRPAEALLESIAIQIVYPSERHPTVG